MARKGGFRLFAATAANGEVAPIQAVRRTLIELRESTLSRPFGLRRGTALYALSGHAPQAVNLPGCIRSALARLQVLGREGQPNEGSGENDQHADTRDFKGDRCERQ